MQVASARAQDMLLAPLLAAIPDPPSHRARDRDKPLPLGPSYKPAAPAAAAPHESRSSCRKARPQPQGKAHYCRLWMVLSLQAAQVARQQSRPASPTSGR